MKTTKATTKIRAAIYARRSTDDDRTSEDGRSVDRQVALARSFCQRQDWSVAEPFVVTEERSGADFTRPGLVRLLEAAEARPRPFDVIACMSVDRVGRDLYRVGATVQRLHQNGVHVWCYQSGQRVEFGTPTDKLMLGVSGFAAEEYRHSIKLKTSEALRAKAGRGHQTSGLTFGYSLVRRGDHTEKEIEPAQAAVVRRVFEMAVEGLGDSRIMSKLSAERVPAPGARGWAKTTVRKILQNELYRGVSTYGRTQTVDDGGRGKRVRVLDESQWVRASVPHLRIIDDALWERVQSRKTKTRAHYLRAPDGRLMGKPESGLVASRLLNGIARCALCGGGMNFMGNPRGAHKNPRYYCLTRSRRGLAGCSLAHGVPIRELDEAVLAELYEKLVRRPEVVAELCEARVAKARREQTGSGERRSAAAAIEKLEAEIGRLVSALAAGKASVDIAEAIAERRGKIEQITATSLAPEPVAFDRAAFFEEMKTISGAWDATSLMNPAHPILLRQMLRRLGVDKVTVHRSADGAWTFESALDPGRLQSVKIGLAGVAE